MLDTIDYSKMITKGAGSSNVCFTDGNIAIKLGNVNHTDVELMNEAAAVNLSVPVWYYERNAKLPIAIMNLIDNYPRQYYYEDGSIPYPVYHIRNKGYANIVIMPYARPLLDNSKEYSDSWISRAIKLAGRVSDKYYNVFGKTWEDDHPWNLGYYRSNLVILDF